MSGAPGSALALLGVVVIVAAISMIRARRSFAPWVPSNRRMVEQALKSAGAAPGEKFADLGCGDGRVITLANRSFSLDAHGFEISLLPYVLAFIRLGWYRMIHGKRAAVHLHFKNLFSVKLSDFDIIFLYGLPEALNARLYQKMEQELRPGTRVISYNFSLKQKKPDQEFHRRWRNTYVYRW